MLQLLGADVDAHGLIAQLWIVLPLSQLLAGGLNAPAAQWNNDVGFFCNRQKDAGRHQTTTRVAPAQQGFESTNVATG